MGRILILHEKHGDDRIEIGSDEELGRVSVDTLKSRLEEGWYWEPEVEKLEAQETELTALIEATTTDETKTELERRLIRVKRDLIEERAQADFLALVKRCVEDDFTGEPEEPTRIGAPGSGRSYSIRPGSPLAFQLLEYRSYLDAEYETIEMIEPRRVSA